MEHRIPGQVFCCRLSAARPGARPAPALHSAPVRLTPSRHHRHVSPDFPAIPTMCGASPVDTLACMCRKHEANARRKDLLYQYQLDYPGLEGVAVCQRVRHPPRFPLLPCESHCCHPPLLAAMLHTLLFPA